MRVPGDPGPALMRIPRASQSACKFRAPSSSPSAKVRSHFRSSASILDTLSAGGPSRPSTASQVWAPPERSCRPAASRFSMKTPDALSSQAMRSPVLKSLWMRAFSRCSTMSKIVPSSGGLGPERPSGVRHVATLL